MRRHSRIPALLAAGALVAGCGDDDVGDPIPNGKVQQLNSQLDAVRSAVDQRACTEIGPAVNQLQNTIASLGDAGVGDDVQNALADGADNLRSLASGECEPDVEETETTETETEEETTPSVPLPAPPETTPEEEPEPLPPEEEPPPEEEEPDEGDGQGQFDGTDDGATGPPGQLKKEKEE